MEHRLNFTLSLDPDCRKVNMQIITQSGQAKAEHNYDLYADNLYLRVQEIANAHLMSACGNIATQIKLLRNKQNK